MERLRRLDGNFTKGWALTVFSGTVEMADARMVGFGCGVQWSLVASGRSHGCMAA